ncbi:MAG: hypothetical protein KBC41_04170 [Candidatus Pacebacteria bacterium]|nr:hypothetical protein [Candidatus Paceibacterota bacterium]MBP9867239.1 hypothetical protein [Candidatus Paceibacterota bacterium]
MKTPEYNSAEEGVKVNENIKKLSQEEINKLSERFDLEKPHQSPEYYEVHKHIQNLLASFSRLKKQEDSDVRAEQTPSQESMNIVKQNEIKEKTERLKRITTNVVDFIPIVGSAKMMIEGILGKQYGTDKEIQGLNRVIHTVSGTAFLALDVTGLGSLLSEVGKGALKIGERAIVRSAEEKIARATFEKETAKLIGRGEKRINEKEKIANSLENGEQESFNERHRK